MKTENLITILCVGLLVGCANRQSGKTLNAKPIQVSIVGPMAKEIQRTAPGEVMDPDAQVFAQVPKRIIYLPGEFGLTGRRSPEQIAAYSLVKVNELPEVQAGQPISVVMTDPSQNPEKGERDIINMTITEGSKTEEGTARSLNVRESVNIDKARGRIRAGETLRFIESTGWVGWIPKGSQPAPKPSQIPQNLLNNPPPKNTGEPLLPPIKPEATPSETPKATSTPTPQPDKVPEVPTKLVPPPLTAPGGPNLSPASKKIP